VPRHLLVTNDFPPKVGGIQTYLWELWRRLPPADVTVLTTPHPDAAGFDSSQPFRVERSRDRVLLPTPGLAAHILALAAETDAELIVLDPALPVGLLGPHLPPRRPYGLVVHGSELLGRLPIGSSLMGRVVAGAAGVIAAGGYPAAEAVRTAGRGRVPPVTVIAPGVDVDRFRPLTADERRSARGRWGVAEDALVVAGISRLVARKGFDVLIDAAALLAADPDGRFGSLEVLIGGGGREAERLARKAGESTARVRMVGRVADDDLPAFYGLADVFAMPCHTRWSGLEPEGFGIVFLEAAACGVPQVAGDSGGAGDAVVDGETGFVVGTPGDPASVATAIGRLLADPELRRRMADASRRRAVADHTYDDLAARLEAALDAMVGST